MHRFHVQQKPILLASASVERPKPRRTVEMPGDASIGLYFAFYAFIFEHGPLYMAGAATADEHADVEKMMCEDLPSMCPCNAKNLQVNLQVSGAVEGTAMECGDSQTRADMAALPIIKPPTGVTLDQVWYTQGAV